MTDEKTPQARRETARPRVALIGASGYARVHLNHLTDFHSQGHLEFVAVVDMPAGSYERGKGQHGRAQPEVLPDFDSLLSSIGRLKIDLCVVPTPIHLHTRMTIALLKAGVDVLVEKPLCSTGRDAEAIMQASRSSGRFVAVGFQYFHAPEVASLKQRLIAGDIGTIKRIVVHGAWPRAHSYYTRNTWAGHLSVGPDTVLDSPISNAMAHFVMLMLYLTETGSSAMPDPTLRTAELYRAQDIQSFDTAIVSLESANGIRMDFYGSHSTEHITRPSLRIEGEKGHAEWVQDSHAELRTGALRWRMSADSEAITRERMLGDILARYAGKDTFFCGPERAAAHVRLVEALHRSAPIHPLPGKSLSTRREGEEVYTYVPGLDQWLATAAERGSSLSEAGAQWAVGQTVIAGI